MTAVAARFREAVQVTPQADEVCALPAADDQQLATLEMAPASRLAARLADLSRAQLLEIAAAGCEASTVVKNQADAILAAHKPVAQGALEGVLLSCDLLPLILGPLELEDRAAAAVCSRWAAGWKATSEVREFFWKVQKMGLEAVVAALRRHVAEARVAGRACEELAYRCKRDGSKQGAAEAGAIEAVVAAMRAHPRVAKVQYGGCSALVEMCSGDDAAAAACRQQAVAAGAIEAVVEATRPGAPTGGDEGARFEAVRAQKMGCLTLAIMIMCNAAAAPGHQAVVRQQAVAAGAIEAVVAVMRAHAREADGVQRTGCLVLSRMCYGDYYGDNTPVVAACRQQAVAAGAIEAVVEAMRAHPQVVSLQVHGCGALANICYRNDDAAVAARGQQVAAAGAIEAAVAAMQAHQVFDSNLAAQSTVQQLLGALGALLG